MPLRAATRRLAAVAAVAALPLALMACQADTPVEAPTPTATATATSPSVTPTATPTPTPEPPTLQPDGDAADNLPYFDLIVNDYVGAYGRGERVILLEHLRVAGFDPALTEAGWTTTPSGLQEVSIEAAVRFGEACVVATIRDDRATTTTLPVLSTGRCLIGDGFSGSG